MQRPSVVAETDRSQSCRQHLVMADHTTAVTLHTFNCLSHVLSWVPLQTVTTHAPGPLLTKVLQSVAVGRRPASDAEGRVTEAAMGCVNELIAKNHVPSPTCEQFLLALITHMLTLLRTLTNDTSGANDDHQMISVRLDQLSARSHSQY